MSLHALADEIGLLSALVTATFTRSTRTPGTDCRMTQGSRAVGTASISNSLIVAPVPVLRGSSSGVSALMVMDSSSAGVSFISMVELVPTFTSTDRLREEKPCSSLFRK